MQNERPLVTPSAGVNTDNQLVIATDEPGALEQNYAPGAISQPDGIYIEHERGHLKALLRGLSIGTAAALLLGGGATLWLHAGNQPASVTAGNFNVVKTSLSGITAPSGTDSGDTLRVDGNVSVSKSVILTPTSKPSKPTAGQLYYDKDANQLAYYNGQAFLTLGSGTGATTNVTNFLGNTVDGVGLQQSTPGTQQAGNFNISGVGIVGTLQTTVINSSGGTLYVNPISATNQQQIAAGTNDTLGLTSGSATSGFGGWANELSATKITTKDVGGTAKTIGVVFKGGSSSNHVQVAIYDDDGNVPSRPGSMLASSAIVNLTPDGTTTVTVPNITLAANTNYWLAVNTDDNTVARTYNLTNKASCFVSSGFGFMPDPFSVGSCFFDNNQYSIFLTYTVGSGTSGSLSKASIAVGPSGQVLFQNATDSSTAFQIQNAQGTSTLFSVDTINGRIGIGKITPTAKLDIAGGDINLSNGHSLKFGSLQALSVSSDGATTTISNFVSGGEVSVQSAGFAVQDADATHRNLSIDSNGAAVFSNKTDTTAGFQIQNAAGKNMLTLDTTNSELVLGNDGDAANVSAISIRGGDASGNNISGKNLVISAGNGTGTGGSGDILFNTASGVSNPLVTLDATSGAEGDTTTGLTWSHNTGAHPDPILLIAVNAQAASNPATATSVTYNGVALTRLTELSATESVGSLWYMINPPSGSHTVSVTFSGTFGGTGGAATTFYNVDQTDPIGGFNTQSVNFGTSVSTTLTGTNAGQVAFDALLSRQDLGFPIPGLGQTQLYEQLSNNVNTASYRTANAGSTTMQWSGTGVGSSLNHILIALNPEPNVNPDPMTEALRITQGGTLGVSLSASENAIATISLGGTADRSIVVNQNPTTGSGHSLTVQAGGGAIGNNNGGDLLLQGGIATGTGTAGSVIVRPPSDSANAFQVQNAANTATVLSVDTTNHIVTVTNLAVTGHIITSGTAPASTAGTAACTTPTINVSGNDTSGTITITTGTGCASNGALATLTFDAAFGAAPHVLISPGSSTALTLGAYVDNATVSTTDFTLSTNGTPVDSTAYEWNYLVVQ